MRVMTVNTGSTSTKLDAFEIDSDGERHLHADHADSTEGNDRSQLRRFLDRTGVPDVVIHRVVHGGSGLVESRPITDEVEAEIEDLAVIAPLHNPRALHWIRLCREAVDRPQAAAFDTAYFAGLPERAKSYAIDRQLAAEHHIRRYGFHGIAHRAMWQRWCELRPDLPDGGRLVTLQLGGGCSITANDRGRPVDNSMGFSPLEGLVMATRSGDIDPSVVIHLLRNTNLGVDEIESLLNEQAGLLGVSGRSKDINELLDTPGTDAELAIDLYCYRLHKYLGAYMAVLGGVDGIIFGGGVGEHLPEIRRRVLGNMQWCGVELDSAANAAATGEEAHISSAESRVDIRVLPVDEAGILAGEAWHLFKDAPA